MKIILIKDSKIGKENQILEVSNGYAKNFLIPNKIAIPYNEKTITFLNKKKILKNKEQEIFDKEKNEIKKSIENIVLRFNLKTNNGLIHNTISKKKIIEELKKNKLEIDGHCIENVKINKIGITNIKINLTKNMKATLKIEVTDDK